MRSQTRFVFMLLVISLVGCANANSIYRTLNVDEGQGALIDIKQRAVIVSRQTNTASSLTETRTLVCAEPSPDALSAYAAQLAIEGVTPQGVSAKLAASSQESSSFVGLRTQSIQLLREAQFNLCLGYMNGALDGEQYDILMRRYQKYMVALLAIEQLTGTVRTPTVTIDTKGSAEVARSISDLRTERTSIATKIKALEDKKKADGITEDQKADLDMQIEELKKDSEAVTKGIENARGLTAIGSATATIMTGGLATQRSDEHIQAIAEDVKAIVLEIINTDDTGQLCFAYLSGKKPATNEALNTLCTQYMKNLSEGMKQPPTMRPRIKK